MKKKKVPVKLQKIPLEGFIDLLSDLYEKGADYIDIIGTPDEDQDLMSVIVKVEYIDPENNGFDMDDPTFIKDEEIVTERKLSDEDLDALI